MTSARRSLRLPRELEIHRDLAALVDAAAGQVVALARDAVTTRGRFMLALAGGETPRPLYERLAQPPFVARIDWSRAHFFFGDERCVPPDHPESNYRMARAALFDRVPIPEANVHRIAGEDAPHEAARAYERVLREHFGGDVEGPPDRSFDLTLLGMGADGHTASLFPGTPAVTEAHRWVVATSIAGPHPSWRVTLTPVVLNASAVVTFLVAGANKSPRLTEILEGGAPAAMLPAARIRPTRGSLHWMVDAAAAGGIVSSLDLAEAEAAGARR